VKFPRVTRLQASVGATVQPSTFVLTLDDKSQRFVKLPTLRKIKRAAIQSHKPTQIAAHLIFPNRMDKDIHQVDNLTKTFK